MLISFEEPFTSVYEDLIKTPLEAVGFEVERADSRLDQQSILQDIFRGIAGADLVVADLTGLNPNVFYELGVAHALAIPTILLTQNVEELPFDLRAYRANEYSTHFQEATNLVAKIEDIGRGAIDGSISFSSPATDFLPPDFQRRPPAASGAAAPPPDQAEEHPSVEPEDVAWLDAMEEGEQRNEAFLSALQRIGEATEEVGNQMAERTEELERVNAGPEAARVKQASSLAIRAADHLNQYAAALERDVPVVEENSSLMLDPMRQYLAWLQANPELDARDQVAELQESANSTLEAVRDSLPNLREFRQVVVGLRGYSRAINSASARVEKGLDRLISATETIEAESARFVTASQVLLDRAVEQDPDPEDAD